MESKNRKQIPRDRADLILFETDRTCCICEDSSKSVQIHHLDGDSSNNNPDNLAVLCLDHHNEASLTGGLGRKLSKGQIRKYRDNWLKKIRNQRENSFAIPLSDEKLHKFLLEALACHEIRKIKILIVEADWSTQIPLLNSLFQYTSFDYGYYVKIEILYTLNLLANKARFGMHEENASIIENLTFSAVPIISLVQPSIKPISENNTKLLLSSVEIGFSISNAGIKFLKNLKILAAGARLLSTILRYAHLNNLQKVKVEVLDKFKRLIETGNEDSFTDAVKWVQFERDDALALEKDQLPKLPEDILKKLNDNVVK